MAISIEKGLGGREDTAWDNTGAGATFPRKTSDGSFKEFTKVNAGHVPTTTATRAKTLADGSTTPGSNVDACIQAMADSLNSIGVPDDSTLENSSGTLQVKALGVDTAQLAAGAVEEAKLATDSVTNAKIGALAVDTAELAASAVETAKINDSAVTAAKINDSAVSTIKIADADGGSNGVNINKLDMDGSGTGPVLFPVLTGTHTIAGGAATENENITGLLSSDNVVAIPQVITNGVALVTVVANNGSVDYTWTADPGAGSSVDYIVYRATSV